VALEGEAEGPAQAEVVIDTLVKVAHRAPPVHERTTWRKAAWSTFNGVYLGGEGAPMAAQLADLS
jgi:hypothetical protein